MLYKHNDAYIMNCQFLPSMNILYVKYTHVQLKRTTLPKRIFVAYHKLCKIVLFIIIILDKCDVFAQKI